MILAYNPQTGGKKPMDFSHLKSLDVRDKTAPYTIHQIAGAPVLTVRPATEANKPYFNAVLKRSRNNVRALKAGALSQAMIAENREQDRELFPRFVVIGWADVVDSQGAVVPFTAANCADFLRALPDWIFDDLRNFAGDSVNFAGEMPDIVAKAKN
jgi:hypothetical protein